METLKRAPWCRGYLLHPNLPLSEVTGSSVVLTSYLAVDSVQDSSLDLSLVADSEFSPV